MIAFVQTSPQGQTGCSFLQRAQMKHKLSHARLTSSFGILSILSMIRNTSGTWSVATPKLSKMADRTVRLDTLKTTSFCSKPAAHDLLECLMQRIEQQHALARRDLDQQACCRICKHDTLSRSVLPAHLLQIIQSAHAHQDLAEQASSKAMGRPAYGATLQLF